MSTQLNSDEQLLIYRLLKKHENIFHDTLVKYASTMYKIELQEGDQPYYSKTFPNKSL